MTDRSPRIARVRLARSLPRLLAVPVLLLLAGAGLAAYGALASPMPVGWLFVAAGSLVGLSGLAWGAWLLSVRLDVEEAAIRVRWLGGGHRYVLSPGAVTRVRLRGADASRLRVRTGILGWGIGPGRLREEEDIHVVRLAPTPTAILVPTRDGRLAVAAAVESELLDALAQAARARQRTAEETAVETVAAAPPDEQPPASTEAEAEPEFAPPSAPPTAEAPPAATEPRFMTGIERAQYERRLADALESGATVPPAPAEAETPPVGPPGSVPASAAVAEKRRRRLPRPSIRRPAPSWALVLLPVVATGAVWGLALAGDRLPPPDSDLGRLTSLALVLAGPASAVGAIVARVWWPRLMAAVVVAGLAATILVGRALLS